MDRIGFWNIRGMNSSRKQNDINFFLQNKDVGLFGLLETRIKNKALLRDRCNFKTWSISTNNGFHNGGRIWIIWKPLAYRVHFIEYNAQYIHMKVDSLVKNQAFFLTMVYAFNGAQERIPLWDNLRRLASSVSGPWAIMGDFNCVLSASERVGGNSSLLGTDQFRDCVRDGGVIDLQSIGAFYTWNNKQRTDGRIFSKLDRVLVNKAWSDHFREPFAHFLPKGLSDHSPCLVNFLHRTHLPRSFKYFNMWGLSEKFLPVLKEIWDKEEEGYPMYRIIRKQKKLKPALKELNQDCFSDIERKTETMELWVKQLQQELGQCPFNPILSEDETNARQELRILKEAMDLFLAQKSKIRWCIEGDQNTHFFHGVIRSQRQRNKVLEIEDSTGNICDNLSDIQQAFLEYYTHLLGESQGTTKVHQTIIKKGSKWNADMIRSLMVPVTGKEIKEALFSIPDIKSPGPDGYTSKFYKDAWNVIGEEVIAAIKDFFAHKRMLKKINSTSLVLIPNVQRPKNVSQFRPIAYCNVLYKVISKLLCERLAAVLPLLVDINQGAFIHSRNIQENILICQDLVRLYEIPQGSPKCLFKINLQKAYDTVEWTFIDQLLTYLKVPAEFRSLIMQCVTTATYTLSVNGNNFGFFKGKRGLRQGDPLSPLLFTICMDYLTRILRYAAHKHGLNYHPMCKELQLTNLMFADDVLMFCKGDANSMITILKAFTTFSKTSGLQASPTKSAAFFGGMIEELKLDILTISGFSEGTFPFFYLGMQIQTTRLKKGDCECLIEKICNRIHTSGARTLSYAGRVVLVKVVLTSLHSYWASTFVLPKGVIIRIEAICRNYLWDSSAYYKHPPMVSWSNVCRPKEEGGLGIKCQQTSNIEMVGKLVHWVAKRRYSLWVKWVYTNYIKEEDWIQYCPSPNTTWTWKRICAVKDRLSQGFIAGHWTFSTTGYCPTEAYAWLRGRSQEVPWHDFVWNQWVVPKHQFIGWLFAQGGLKTKARLLQYGLSKDSACSSPVNTASRLFNGSGLSLASLCLIVMCWNGALPD
ncbi:hypothetical protein vseg_017742 [Gypsophila vaccaria]